jgi:hypothetical protein
MGEIAPVRSPILCPFLLLHRRVRRHRTLCGAWCGVAVRCGMGGRVGYGDGRNRTRRAQRLCSRWRATGSPVPARVCAISNDVQRAGAHSVHPWRRTWRTEQAARTLLAAWSPNSRTKASSHRLASLASRVPAPPPPSLFEVSHRARHKRKVRRRGGGGVKIFFPSGASGMRRARPSPGRASAAARATAAPPLPASSPSFLLTQKKKTALICPGSDIAYVFVFYAHLKLAKQGI